MVDPAQSPAMVIWLTCALVLTFKIPRQISAFKIMNNSSAYFLRDQANDFLPHVYGVAFPKAEQMKE